MSEGSQIFHDLLRMLLINQLPRKPSKASLEQFTFLQEIISKEYEYYCKAWKTEEGIGNIMHRVFDTPMNALKQTLSKDTPPSPANANSNNSDKSEREVTRLNCLRR